MPHSRRKFIRNLMLLSGAGLSGHLHASTALYNVLPENAFKERKGDLKDEVSDLMNTPYLIVHLFVDFFCPYSFSFWETHAESVKKASNYTGLFLHVIPIDPVVYLKEMPYSAFYALFFSIYSDRKIFDKQMFTLADGLFRLTKTSSVYEFSKKQANNDKVVDKEGAVIKFIMNELIDRSDDMAWLREYEDRILSMRFSGFLHLNRDIEYAHVKGVERVPTLMTLKPERKISPFLLSGGVKDFNVEVNKVFDAYLSAWHKRVKA